MSLKAVLFDFKSVIINHEQIHSQLIDEILIQENLQPQKLGEHQALSRRSDRTYLQELLSSRGRVVSQEYVNKLLHQKAQAYVQQLENIPELPLYPGVLNFINQVRSLSISPDDCQTVKLALISGAIRQEIELVLERALLSEYFSVMIADDDLSATQSQPDAYLLAVERLNQLYPDFHLQPAECLAIEGTPVGVAAAKQAHIQVLGVAHNYPFHMLQRRCNWTVDYLYDLELERVQEVFLQKDIKLTAPGC